MHKFKCLVLVAALAVFSCQANGQELLVNPGFEAVDLTDWGGGGSGGSGSAFIGAPAAGPQSGSNSVMLALGGDVGQVLQIHPAAPGEVHRIEGYMLTEAGLPSGPSFGLLKIVFRDASGTDLTVGVDNISVGGENPDFPGVEAAPFLNDSSPTGTWVNTIGEGVAPAGTVEVLYLLLNVDFAGGTNPIWMDNISVTVDGGANVLANPDFEMGLDGWDDPFSDGTGPFTLGSPPFGVFEGLQAVEFASGNATTFLAQSMPASPGDEFNMSVRMLTVFGLPAGDSFGLAKIVFRDAEGTDLEPDSLSIGEFGPEAAPGVDSRPLLNNDILAGVWEFSEAQGVAPAGTVEVLFFLLNVDFAGGTNPIWFDDSTAALVSSTGCEVGDVNGDGNVDLLDVGPFVDAITGGTFSCEADINEDGNVDLLDVGPFVTLLTDG